MIIIRYEANSIEKRSTCWLGLRYGFIGDRLWVHCCLDIRTLKDDVTRENLSPTLYCDQNENPSFWIGKTLVNTHKKLGF